MGAKSYLFCDVKRFYEDSFFRPIQTSFLENEGQSELEILKLDTVISQDFNIHHGKFDFERKQKGKVFGKVFSKFFEPLEFPIFYNENLNLCIIQTKSEAALEFIRQLNSSNQFDLINCSIDFDKIIKRVPEISGAWIAGLKGQHLKTAGYFGPNVHLSPEYNDAIKRGEISAMSIKWIDKDHIEYCVTISKKGSITIYNNFDNHQQEFEFIIDIYLKLIK
ncbi:hypothetical protein ACOQFO_03725 [Ureibacillus sp. MALMAid1270]|uniref:hypothetical protein n=1 Tax=Ureibacillus sp. MALMAid1270 TaxID=3411629 RepID=UPI003BA3FFEF